MTTVNYTSFQDTDLILPDPTTGDIDRDVNFSTPSFDTTKSGVLSFRVLPGSTGSPNLNLAIKEQGTAGAGTTVYSETFGSNTERVIQENINQSLLHTDNTLVVTVTGGGSITVSDFHILYKKV
jgi:hypothetical protein